MIEEIEEFSKEMQISITVCRNAKYREKLIQKRYKIK